ncbi:DUF2892 domain-containing protein [Candidatus Woesearchaeota archaeon]|nr:MAG: DUF2892 domain-containing protein [Candidatus Woesearchaeota archaeon]
MKDVFSERNVGSIDRLVRLIFSLVFFIMGMLYQPLWLAVSVVLLLTAVFGACPCYSLLGINTCEVRRSRKK